MVELLHNSQRRSPDEYAIKVDLLSKHFRIPKERKHTTYDHLVSLLPGRDTAYDEFWALKDVSFSVQKGETFGVIGANGSGKSTLLKILAGVLYPDSGTVDVNGKIAPFLELGVGFQPDLSARENIYLYGSIMGLSKKSIATRYDEILDFSDLRRFEHMRLKNFSSGMTIRLAFATAIQTDPDILLVDEVFAVGDEAFQRKCTEKIEEIKRAGKTIVYVSHALESVRELCSRCLALDHGRIRSLGETNTVIEDYLAISASGSRV
ncbi:ABC transporter ATP-binding protein [Methanocalculus sp.]|uniref:ABC transporter ATP-binding protein n=1 Tax=Methanocalculus sp. TaxID=2004547 RepID=UPI00271B88D8|nr:ABC transporter ATP-binding protein [Methanocalculus sp.]MDO8842204.1 ABC transporter ATP-binding protein [Methanocalculus sp.]